MVNKITTVFDAEVRGFQSALGKIKTDIKGADGAIGKMKAGWGSALDLFKSSPSSVWALSCSTSFRRDAIRRT